MLALQITALIFLIIAIIASIINLILTIRNGPK